jgi:hypothetical protein
MYDETTEPRRGGPISDEEQTGSLRGQLRKVR